MKKKNKDKFVKSMRSPLNKTQQLKDNSDKFYNLTLDYTDLNSKSKD